MKRIHIIRLIAILFLGVAGCATTPYNIERDELSEARAAISQAKQARAERCAPDLMAKAVSRLYWAAHELHEGGHADETSSLIADATAFAKKAESTAASNCKAETTVILMPDENGQVGSLSVASGGKSQPIDKAFNYTRVSGRQASPEAVNAMSEEAVKQQFGELLKAQPKKAAHFILYFTNGTSELTEESRAMIPEVLAAAKARFPSEISIIGHSDATGSAALNLKISSKRARAVERLIKDTALPPKSTYVRFHGENDPLIPTPDNVPEPRNRRVEIVIL